MGGAAQRAGADRGAVTRYRAPHPDPRANTPAELTAMLGADIASLWGHLLPKEAGELAKQAGAEQLLLSHFWPACDLESSAREASEALGRPVEIARVNRSYVV